jgi:hypothetical protein
MSVQEVSTLPRCHMHAHNSDAAGTSSCCILPGDKRGGAVRVLYDTTTSERGALLAVGRAPRQASMFDAGLPLVIKTPHALPMYKEDTGRKRSRDKARQVCEVDVRAVICVNSGGAKCAACLCAKVGLLLVSLVYGEQHHLHTRPVVSCRFSVSAPARCLYPRQTVAAASHAVLCYHPCRPAYACDRYLTGQLSVHQMPIAPPTAY